MKYSLKQLERRLERLMREDGDHCSICRTRFTHNSRTWAGVGPAGEPAITSHCCADKLRRISHVGIYAARSDYDFPQRRGAADRAYTQQQIDAGIAGYQRAISRADQVRDKAVKEGGVPAAATGMVTLLDAPFKDDDRKWFEANPTRSHRLRPMFPGEFAEERLRPARTQAPEGHELQVLVRQVEPDLRVRTVFCRNTAAQIPDNEAFLHALFDLAAAGGETRAPITGRELAAAAAKYSIRGARPS